MIHKFESAFISGSLWTSETRGNASFASMSEDEKERSAAELMSLIERLNNTGVIRCDLQAPKK